MARLGNKAVVQKLFSPEFKARFQDRPGGYTRILKLAHRLGDGADTDGRHHGGAEDRARLGVVLGFLPSELHAESRQ